MRRGSIVAGATTAPFSSFPHQFRDFQAVKLLFWAKIAGQNGTRIALT
jgi:hypothetical protein